MIRELSESYGFLGAKFGLDMLYRYVLPKCAKFRQLFQEPSG
jgi:hypothetical protein